MQAEVKSAGSAQQGHHLPAQPADEHFERRVAAYRKWLSEQTRRHKGRVQQEMDDYAARALQVVEVGSNRIQTFAPFRYKYSALQTITRKQILFASIIALVWAGCMAWRWKETLVCTISLITPGYLSHLILDVFLALRVIHSTSEEHIDEAVIAALKDADWPTYTILCPLYKEAAVVPQFVQAMRAIDYPTEKLQILFLTEEDDAETRRAILSLRLPPHFHIVTVPDGAPRTKPRAFNYGLVEATGQYVVIYDAEDMPDPLQLKKAVLTFANHGADLACVQAKLNFYNPQQNLLTRWFTAEYSLWFDLILPGLQEAKLAIPLGGTSNHFPTQALRALGGWDAFNVTEDCDLGLRLSWFRLKTVVVDSTRSEEHTSELKNWIRQRSRWIKGYMQTYLVHMREPLHYIRYRRFRELFSLQVLIGGKTAILLINPVMWVLLAMTLFFQSWVKATFASLFPTPIIYMSIFTLLLGNFFYGYIYLLGCMKREQYSLVKWMLLIPVYWFLASVAACMALYELFTRPHYWQKTINGLHLQPDAQETAAPEWEEIANLAEKLTPITPTGGPTLLHGSGIYSKVQKYDKLEHVPVASVQDTIESMIEFRKPALPPSEREALHHPQHHKADRWLLVTIGTAILLSISACYYFFQQRQLLTLQEATQHIRIVQQFISGPDPFDFKLLGGTWHPLPHIAMLPFACNPSLTSTGLAGSIPSMIAYVLTGAYVFLMARALTGKGLISYLGTLVFLLNPSILYFQSVPVSELLGIATLTMSCYYLLAWAQDDRLKNLLLSAASICLATLCRYDAWIFFFALAFTILLIGLRKRHKREQVASNLLVYSILGMMGMGLWVLWCWRLFNDPLYFIHARFGTQAQSSLLTTHHLWQTLQFYGTTSLETLGPVLSVLVALSLVVFLIRYCFKPEMFAALTLLVPFGLYVAAMYSGHISLILPSTDSIYMQDYLFRARLGAELVAPSAIFLTTLAGKLKLKTRKTSPKAALQEKQSLATN